MTAAPVREPSETRPEDALTAFLRACADPARLAILRLLAVDAFGVGELGSMLGLGQATVSHHLKALTEVGLLQARRDGTHTFYRRALPGDAVAAAVHRALLDELDAAPLPDAHVAAREAVYETRAERSRDFFTRHADRFDATRDLIADPTAYFPELAELLPASGARALELGPGPGDFLPELARRFEAVLAVDVSEEMLERARAFVREHALDNVTLQQGELAEGEAVTGPFDTVVCAMVLHHAPRPAELLARCAALVGPGGSLLLAELCPHGQDWTRDACGDVWPGFEADELRAWAEAAGLARGPSQFLAQRNGFRIQLQRFERSAEPPDEHTGGDAAQPTTRGQEG
jgi:ArsR family transcriptional regulator